MNKLNNKNIQDLIVKQQQQQQNMKLQLKSTL